MSAQDNGGPAFPFPAYTYPNGEINHGEGGATLRDYFAAKYVQGILASGCCTTDHIRNHLAADSYAHADQMLEARK
jgi:hypothetical protein